VYPISPPEQIKKEGVPKHPHLVYAL